MDFMGDMMDAMKKAWDEGVEKAKAESAKEQAQEDAEEEADELLDAVNAETVETLRLLRRRLAKAEAAGNVVEMLLLADRVTELVKAVNEFECCV